MTPDPMARLRTGPREIQDTTGKSVLVVRDDSSVAFVSGEGLLAYVTTLQQEKAALEALLAGLERVQRDTHIRAEQAEATTRRLRETLDGIASPLHIDGENHMAAVQHARAALVGEA